MKSRIQVLAPFDPKTGALHVLVETPKGSRCKYAYDEKTGLLRLKKILPAGMAFPFNFGFVPGTRGGDGDPLDVVVLHEEALFPGSFVKARIIGAILAKQRKKDKLVRNDRLIVEPLIDSPQPKPCNFRIVLKEMKDFFVTAHHLEGRDFKILKYVGKREARSLLNAAIAVADSEVD